VFDILVGSQQRLFSRIVNRAFRSNDAMGKILTFVEATDGEFGESPDGLLTLSWPKPKYTPEVQRFVTVLMRHKLAAPKTGGYIEFNIEVDPAGTLDSILASVNIFEIPETDAAEELV